jgi:signal transduction histidine kinase/ligand-binding sensor domain-containing protein
LTTHRLGAARTALAALTLSFIVLDAHAADGPQTVPYAWRSWTRHDGLRGSQVWTVAQDRSGYLWLGTNEGLVRFDGARFVSGQLLGGGGLPQNSVRTLCVARDGTLWIGFGGPGGVSRLRGRELRNYDADDGLPEALITSLFEDRRGVVWAGSLNGLFRFEDGRWHHVDPAAGLRAQIIDGVYEDARGYLWLGTSDGVFRRRNDRSEPFERISRLRIESFAEDRLGRVWGTGADAVLVLLTATPPRPMSEVGGRSAGRRLLHDREGNLWIATLGDGLLRVHMRGDALTVERFSGIGTLSSDVVRALVQDREGNLWIGTQNGLDRGSNGVIRSLPAPGDTMTRLVRAVAAAADGSIWVGTGDGLYRFANGTREHYGRESGLPSLAIAALHGDRSGTMWVATDRGVGRFVSGRFVLSIPAGSPLSRPIALTSDRDGALWLCDLDRGVFRWDGTNLTFVGSGSENTPRPAFSILADSKNRVWAGFVDGTLAVHERGGSRLYTASDGLTGGMITSLYEDRTGTVWIGASSGFMRFRDGRFEGVSWNSGLPGNIVGAIAGDDAGQLWLGVSSGIVRLSPDDFDKAIESPDHRLAHVLYDASDGLRGDPIGLGHPTVARGGDGSLWFVTSDGLAVIAPRSSEKNRMPPPVVIEEVTADQQSVSFQDRTRLPPLTANLQIDYAALSFTAPEKVRFRYLMEGFDRDWVEAGTRRQAFYTNLGPGEYRFRVTATNDGVPADREAVWEFSLAPAFYQTQWFAAAALMLLAAGVAAAWRARVHQVRGRFSSILVERTRVAREIHDTLLQSLLGVLLRLDEVANTIDVSTHTAKEQLVRLRQQVEFYAREARHSIRDLRSPVLQTRDLAAALREAGERLTAMKPIVFELVATGKPYRGAQRVEEHLLRIGQEAISNAVRHGNPRSVRVELRYGVESIVLRVSDDGVGCDPQQAGAACDGHWGLTSMQERAEQIGGTFRLVSSRGKGTLVEVTAPVPQQK